MSTAEAARATRPARDARFVVVDRWAQCVNLPPGDPGRLVEFLHRQMNEEVDSLECSARNLADFPDAEWEIRLWIARQCADEARHAAMFRRLYERRGGVVGQYPVLDFQYRIITACNNLVARLAIQNRSFEAGGLDAIAFSVEDASRQGDAELAALYDAQLADEIVHVRFANEWIQNVTQRDQRTLLRIGEALTAASRAFSEIIGTEGTAGAGYPVAVEARQESGFRPEEIQLATSLARVTQAPS